MLLFYLEMLLKEKMQRKNKYFNYFIICNNPSNGDELVKPLTHLCRKSFDSSAQNPETDYVDWNNSVQRHRSIIQPIA